MSLENIRTMKKQELLKIMDQELLEKLFGFCYARTNDSQEAQELCSDILFELIKAANTKGDIGNLYGFLWRVARNTYADFLEKKKRNSDRAYQGDPEEVFSLLVSEEAEDSNRAMLDAIYRRIAFLTRIYREVMVLFYLDGLSTGEIARRQGIGEGAVRQRLSLARKRIQCEVKEMTESNQKPVVLDRIEYCINGSGDPCWGDPRKVCTKQFSKHLVWLCRKKSVSAAEAAEMLHVPTVYVEEELEILENGENGQYGLLRRLDKGRYAINFILLDSEEMRQLHRAYTEQASAVCRVVSDYVKAHREEYLAFPYLNKEKGWNLILWQQVHAITHIFKHCVDKILAENYFAGTKEEKRGQRSFHVYGYVQDGQVWGGGWNGTEAENLCGYAKIHADNIDNNWIRPHFWNSHNMATDPQLQLALQALEGLAVGELSDMGKEHAAKAIECGYLYREGDMLYTKILVCDGKDKDRLFHITRGLEE